MATQASHPLPVQNGNSISNASPLASPSVPPSNWQHHPGPSDSRPVSSGSRTVMYGILVPKTAATRSPPPPAPEHHVSLPMQQGSYTYHSAPPSTRPHAQSPHPPQMQQPLHPPSYSNPHPPPPPRMHQQHHHHHPSAPPPLTQHQPPPAGNDVPPRNQSLSSPKSAVTTQGSTSYQDLSNMVLSAEASVVRQVVRDHWEKAILGSQYHIAFLLNATIHQATNDTLSSAVKDFGSRMIKVSKQHAVRHLEAEDIDEVADLLLTQAGPSFLDKALTRRLETIPARQLVNALARAERLGYDAHDIVKEGQGRGEHVIPSLSSLALPSQVPSVQATPSSSRAPSAPQASAPPSAQTDLQGEIETPTDNLSIPSQNGTRVVYCHCGWPCSSDQALEYHQKRQSCYKALPSDQVGKELCPHCGCRFSSSGGLQYHGRVGVCGAHTQEQTQHITSIVHEFRKNKAAGSITASTPSKQLALPPWPGISSNQSATHLGRVNAGLTPKQNQELKEEMKKTEEHYGSLMREAMKLPEPEKSKKIAALKNRYNTKQSITRKKYGIRLRERRSKAEINAERIRLFGTPDGPSLSGHETASPAYKRARYSRVETSEDRESTITSQPDESQANMPQKLIPVAEMGGLSRSQATAEMEDPTASPLPAQPWQVPQGQANIIPTKLTGTRDDPMSIDDDSTTESDDDDIPASVPAPEHEG